MKRPLLARPQLQLLAAIVLLFTGVTVMAEPKSSASGSFKIDGVEYKPKYAYAVNDKPMSGWPGQWIYLLPFPVENPSQLNEIKRREFFASKGGLGLMVKLSKVDNSKLDDGHAPVSLISKEGYGGMMFMDLPIKISKQDDKEIEGTISYDDQTIRFSSTFQTVEVTLD